LYSSFLQKRKECTKQAGIRQMFKQADIRQMFKQADIRQMFKQADIREMFKQACKSHTGDPTTSVGRVKCTREIKK
jgi:hypothetical protein